MISNGSQRYKPVSSNHKSDIFSAMAMGRRAPLKMPGDKYLLGLDSLFAEVTGYVLGK